MDDSENVWILIGAIAGGVGLLVLLVVFMRGLQKKRTAEVMAKFKDKKVYGVCSSASFFGVESKGMGQVRGNGVLVLAEGELYFEMWTPKRSLKVPFSTFQAVELVRSHLGKARAGVKLVKLSFTSDQGAPDSAAWQMSNPDHWKSAFEKIIQGKAPA